MEIFQPLGVAAVNSSIMGDSLRGDSTWRVPARRQGDGRIVSLWCHAECALRRTGYARLPRVEYLAANWRLAAVAALFFLGVAARRSGLAGATQGRWLLNLVFNVGLPILIFGALTGVPLRRE